MSGRKGKANFDLMKIPSIFLLTVLYLGGCTSVTPPEPSRMLDAATATFTKNSIRVEIPIPEGVSIKTDTTHDPDAFIWDLLPSLGFRLEGKNEKYLTYSLIHNPPSKYLHESDQQEGSPSDTLVDRMVSLTEIEDTEDHEGTWIGALGQGAKLAEDGTIVIEKTGMCFQFVIDEEPEEVSVFVHTNEYGKLEKTLPLKYKVTIDKAERPVFIYSEPEEAGLLLP